MPHAPDQDAPAEDWLVHADALQRDGDPRGELITLNHAIASGTGDTAARDAFVQANAEALLGMPKDQAEALRIGWKWLTPDTVELIARSEKHAAALGPLLESPLTAGMTSLSIGGDAISEDDKVDLSGAIGAVAARGLPPSCGRLALLDLRAARSTSVIATFYDPPTNMVKFGELGRLWPKIENVRSVRLSVSDGAQVDFGAIEAPQLESFQLDCLTWGGQPELPDALAEAKWPNLKHFAIRLPESWTSSIPDDDDGYTRPYEDREDDYHDADEDGYNDGFDWATPLTPLLESLRATKLERLTITSFDNAASVLSALAEVGLPSTLRELDLSDSTLRNAAWFMSNGPLVSGLERIVLERTPLVEQSVQELRQLGPEIVQTYGAGATYRFLVGME